MYVGVEIEFVTFRNDSMYGGYQESIVNYINDHYSNISSTREYYNHVVEIQFLYPTIKIEDIQKLFKDIEGRYDVTISYETKMCYEPSTYNGLHFHTMCMPCIYTEDLYLILDNLNTHNRFLHSHHIWAGIGDKKWKDWQTKERYLPINPNLNAGKPSTFECRVLNCSSLENDFKIFESIYGAVNQMKLSKEITKLDINFFMRIKDEMVGNVPPEITARINNNRPVGSSNPVRMETPVPDGRVAYSRVRDEALRRSPPTTRRSEILFDYNPASGRVIRNTEAEEVAAPLEPIPIYAGSFASGNIARSVDLGDAPSLGEGYGTYVPPTWIATSVEDNEDEEEDENYDADWDEDWDEDDE